MRRVRTVKSWLLISGVIFCCCTFLKLGAYLAVFVCSESPGFIYRETIANWRGDVSASIEGSCHELVPLLVVWEISVHIWGGTASKQASITVVKVQFIHFPDHHVVLCSQLEIICNIRECFQTNDEFRDQHSWKVSDPHTWVYRASYSVWSPCRWRQLYCLLTVAQTAQNQQKRLQILKKRMQDSAWKINRNDINAHLSRLRA